MVKKPRQYISLARASELTSTTSSGSFLFSARSRLVISSSSSFSFIEVLNKAGILRLGLGALRPSLSLSISLSFSFSLSLGTVESQFPRVSSTASQA